MQEGRREITLSGDESDDGVNILIVLLIQNILYKISTIYINGVTQGIISMNTLLQSLVLVGITVLNS